MEWKANGAYFNLLSNDLGYFSSERVFYAMSPKLPGLWILR